MQERFYKTKSHITKKETDQNEQTKMGTEQLHIHKTN